MESKRQADRDLARTISEAPKRKNVDISDRFREKEPVRLKADVDREIDQARIAHQNIVNEAKKLYDQKISQVQKDKKNEHFKVDLPQK